MNERKCACERAKQHGEKRTRTHTRANKEERQLTFDSIGLLNEGIGGLGRVIRGRGVCVLFNLSISNKRMS